MFVIHCTARDCEHNQATECMFGDKEINTIFLTKSGSYDKADGQLTCLQYKKGKTDD